MTFRFRTLRHGWMIHTRRNFAVGTCRMGQKVRTVFIGWIAITLHA